MVTKGWLAVLGTLVLLAGCAADPGPSILTGPIIVGVSEDQPGFSDRPPEVFNPAGFDIDLMNAIGAGLHTQVTSTPVAIADRDSKLLGGYVRIVIETYSITPSRNHDDIDFAGPYMVSPQALLVRADDNSITNNKDSLKGKLVCTQKFSTSETLKIPGVDPNTEKHPQTTGECVKALAERKIDAVLTDELVLYGYMRANEKEFRVAFPGDFGELQYYGIGLLGGHHADCLTLNGLIRDYVRKQWRSDFISALPDAVNAYPGSVSDPGGFESRFKPQDNDSTRLSCKR